MLIECPECKQNISNNATSCPHCGNPTNNIIHEIQENKATSIFQILAILAFVVTLFTPKLIATLPILATLVLCTLSLFRKEKRRLLSWAVLLLSLFLLLSPTKFSRQASAEAIRTDKNVIISDWTWDSDASFGSDGAVIWTVEVQNKSDKYIESVKVGFTSYDNAGKIITSSFGFIKAIPPGTKRSNKSYADYYGTEKNAKVDIQRISYSK